MNNSTVVEADRLFDGAEVKEDVVVVVENGQIHSVESASEASAAGPDPSAERLHAPFLMPGLIDSHVHLHGFPSGFHGPPAQPPYALTENFLRLLVCNGITSARDTGNYVETIRYCQRWGREHDGPRVFGTSPVLDRPPLLWGFSRWVNDAAAARRAVDELRDAGTGWVSLFHNLSEAQVEAAARRAQKYGLKVAADVRAASPIDVVRAGVSSIEHAENLIPRHFVPPQSAAGVNAGEAAGDGAPAGGVAASGSTSTVEQMQRLSNTDLSGAPLRRLADAMVEHDTALCPTLLYSHRWCSVDDMIHEPNLEYMVAVMPAAEQMLGMRSTMGQMFGKGRFRRQLGISKRSGADQQKVDEGLEKLGRLVAQMHDVGVRIVAGTDTPSPSLVPGFSLHREMELMVRGGMAPVDVLASATSAPASLLGRDDLGVVRKGAVADLLLVDGNPLTQIGDTRRVRTVLKGGVPVDRSTMFEPIRTLADEVA
ncbi:MAG: amidohydrolase family protein [Spirochaetes bacterium]|jgi:imidazolonepropionase-like amidohydrolase|nr:amidohydrolase family protein [Spirochaetota bacterium]